MVSWMHIYSLTTMMFLNFKNQTFSSISVTIYMWKLHKFRIDHLYSCYTHQGMDLHVKVYIVWLRWWLLPASIFQKHLLSTDSENRTRPKMPRNTNKFSIACYFQLKLEQTKVSGPMAHSSLVATNAASVLPVGQRERSSPSPTRAGSSVTQASIEVINLCANLVILKKCANLVIHKYYYPTNAQQSWEPTDEIMWQQSAPRVYSE